MRSLGITLVLAASMGCAHEVPEEPPRTEPFIALTSHFERFTFWPSVEVEPFEGTGGHRLGPTRVFIDSEVPDEGEPFAIGTILIKTVEDGAPESWEVHGMVKRGGGYNPEGAMGWEYFDLTLTPALEPVIAWRGAGDAGDPGAYFTPDGERIACNDCHLLAGSRDHVFSLPTLRDVLGPEL